MRSYASSYDRDTWELTVTEDGERILYKEVSPYHNDEFYKRARRDPEAAKKYIESFRKGEKV